VPLSTTGREHPSRLGRPPSSNTISPLISEMPDAQSAILGKRLGRNGVVMSVSRPRSGQNPTESSKFMLSRISGLPSSRFDFNP
jgi:hypothetical protein